MKVGIYEAKSKLSQMIKLAEEGEEVIITKNGEDVVRLTPVRKKKGDWIGMYKGKIKIHDNFDDPMTEEELALFYGEDE
jgi:prevent-host-death family protein